MPLPYLMKIHKETGKSIASLEKKWEEAKNKAKGEKKEKNFAYITYLFQKMIGLKENKIMTFKEFISESRRNI